jgi:hypothetical protein
VLVDDACFGFGVDLFLLPVDGVLRDPRGLPFDALCCFFGFGSSAALASCITACAIVATVSSGGVCVCEADAASTTLPGQDASSRGSLESKGPSLD